MMLAHAVHATATLGGCLPAVAPPMSRSRKELVAAALSSRASAGVARRLPRWRGVVVLNYHRIGDPAGQPWDRTLWNADEELFDAQLATLAREAEVVTPAEVLAMPRERRAGRRVLLTFDDGYRDNYELAFPLLRRHNLPATFFITTGFLDADGPAWWDEIAWMVRNATVHTLGPGPWASAPLPLGAEEDATIAAVVAHYKTLDTTHTAAYLEHVAEATGAGRCPRGEASQLWMTWEMLREMHAAGMSIGGHTVTHPILARLPAAGQNQEIAGCRARLREQLGTSMEWFAYPVGSTDTFTATTKQALREHGVQLAFSFHGGYGHVRRWDPLDVPRVHVSPRHGAELLRATLWLPQLFARD
ncbi:MAG TPA: polysaccharide deacetylase family protein [Solirubrobacteraceae bacterium]|nr:polysaccharide deacetylase family protein [Solirubrobacteraceae bacterium]